MQINEFLELIHKRRSTRRIKPDHFPDEWVEKILKAGRWAMSGGNGQPWEFIVVKNQETKNKMAKAWAELKPEGDAIEMTRVEELRHPLASHPYTIPPFKDAPVLIVVLGDRRTFQATVLFSDFLTSEGGLGAVYLKNMANATQNMHLAAEVIKFKYCSAGLQVG